jgi:YD repeat-containing protein
MGKISAGGLGRYLPQAGLYAVLKRFDGGAYAISYTYDMAGNRATKATSGGITETYAYDDANKLLNVRNANTQAVIKAYTYDNAGNTVSVTSGNSTTTLVWNAESRVTSVSLPGGGGTVTNTYTYNGLGQRASKTDSTSTFNFVRESDDIDAPVLSDGAASYVQSANGLVSEVRSGTSRFYHADALGSTHTLTSGREATTDTRTLDAFGIVVTVAVFWYQAIR